LSKRMGVERIVVRPSARLSEAGGVTSAWDRRGCQRGAESVGCEVLVPRLVYYYTVGRKEALAREAERVARAGQTGQDPASRSG